MNIRKIASLTVIYAVFIASFSFGQVQVDPTLSKQDLEKRAIQYQLVLSQKMTEQLRDIFMEFNESFYDYQPALDKMNLMILEYSKALERMPIDMPEDGRRLHHLTKELLSRVEKYFAFVKMAGRENPAINAQIYQSMYEVSREREKLAYKYQFM